MTKCDVQLSGATELYFYGELDAREHAEITAHLASCAECREALEELSVIRAALATRPDVSAPAGGDWAPFMRRLDVAVAAERRTPAVEPRLPPAVVARRAPRWSYTSYLSMAALLALVTMSVLFVARSREARVSEEPQAPIAAQARPQPDPQLASASERHLERSKLVVLGMATKDARQSDWEYERELAASLLNDTRLYRLTAEQRGMTRLAGVLRDLEIVLLQTSLTDTGDPAALGQIQRLIHKRDLIEQMEYARTEGN